MRYSTRGARLAKGVMNDPDVLRSGVFSSLLSFFLLSHIAVSYGQITSCPVPRLPQGEADRGDERPLPLPSVSTLPPLGGFSSAEYGLGNGVTIPYTTAAAYGARYSSGAMVETYEPSRNMPYVIT